MPIAREMIYKCPKCGYVMTKTVGDVMSPIDFLVTCPKCGEKMKVIDKLSFLDLIKSLFKGNL